MVTKWASLGCSNSFEGLLSMVSLWTASAKVGTAADRIPRNCFLLQFHAAEASVFVLGHTIVYLNSFLGRRDSNSVGCHYPPHISTTSSILPLILVVVMALRQRVTIADGVESMERAVMTFARSELVVFCGQQLPFTGKKDLTSLLGDHRTVHLQRVQTLLNCSSRSSTSVEQVCRQDLDRQRFFRFQYRFPIPELSVGSSST